MPNDCTFATNVYEKTYRERLQPGYINAKIKSHHFDFKERIVTINNVHDMDDAVSLATQLIQLGEIDRYVIVADEMPAVFRKAKMSPNKLRKIPYYSTGYLAVLSATNTTYVMYNDIETTLTTPGDWITEAIEKLEHNPNIIVVNPSFTIHPIEKDAYTYFGNYAVDFGFSDLIFIVRSSLIYQPFHQHMHWASLRYPLAHVNPVFEQWIDSYLRTFHLMRFTDRRFYLDHETPGGENYPQYSIYQKIKRRINVFLWPIALRRSRKTNEKLLESLLMPSKDSDPIHQELLKMKNK